ncbi:MAG: ion transporter [Woeseiaceae bacterium]
MHGSASTSENASNRPVTLRQSVYCALDTAQGESGVSLAVDVFLIALIAGSVGAVILESIPSFEAQYAWQLGIFEVFTVAVFTVEYLLRVWCSVEQESLAQQTATQARLRYMTSFHAVIDLVAILPFYLLALGLTGGVDMRFLRAVRLLRVLKLTRYSAAMNMVFITFRENGRALSAAFLILLTVMLLAASGMYYFERESQPDDFGSIPAAMWWAFATLTTVGYGDVTPITVGGKIFGALITVVGIGMVALPTSILASGYTQQLKVSTSVYEGKAAEALDDGILSDDEIKHLEELRVDLGLGKHTASQILDEGRVKQMLRQQKPVCPHCHQALEKGQQPA